MMWSSLKHLSYVATILGAFFSYLAVPSYSPQKSIPAISDYRSVDGYDETVRAKAKEIPSVALETKHHRSPESEPRSGLELNGRQNSRSQGGESVRINSGHVVKPKRDHIFSKDNSRIEPLITQNKHINVEHDKLNVTAVPRDSPREPLVSQNLRFTGDLQRANAEIVRRYLEQPPRDW